MAKRSCHHDGDDNRLLKKKQAYNARLLEAKDIIGSNANILESIYSQIELSDISTILSVIQVERKSFEHIKVHCIRLLMIIRLLLTRPDEKYIEIVRQTNLLNVLSTLPYMISDILCNYDKLINRRNIVFILKLVIAVIENAPTHFKRLLDDIFTPSVVASSSSHSPRKPVIDDDDNSLEYIFKHHRKFTLTKNTKVGDLFWIDTTTLRIRPFIEFTGVLQVFELPKDRKKLTIKNEVDEFAMKSATGLYQFAIFYMIHGNNVIKRPAEPDDSIAGLIINGEHIFSRKYKMLLCTLFVDSRFETMVRKNRKPIDPDLLQQEWQKYLITTNGVYTETLIRFFNRKNGLQNPKFQERIDKLLHWNEDTKIKIDMTGDDDESSRNSSEINVEEEEEEEEITSSETTTSIIDTDDEGRYNEDEEEDEISTEIEEDDDDDDDDSECDDEEEEDWSIDESSSFSISTPSTTDDDDDDDDADDDEIESDEEISTTY